VSTHVVRAGVAQLCIRRYRSARSLVRGSNIQALRTLENRIGAGEGT